MQTTENRMLVSLFEDPNVSKQAVDALEDARFGREHISYSGHRPGFMTNMKSFFTGESTESLSAAAIYNDLIRKGMPEPDAKFYQREFLSGKDIVAVIAPIERVEEATRILQQFGGYGYGTGPSERMTRSALETEVRTSSNIPDQTWASPTADPGITSESERLAAAAAADTEEARRLRLGETGSVMPDSEESRHLRLREEQLRVYKQPVETGEVRLHKNVIAEQKEVSVPVTHEEVWVEQVPGTGQISNEQITEGETLRVPVRDEQVTTRKEVVDSGEIRMGKRKKTETKTVGDTVRREEARIERTGDVEIHGTDIDTNPNR